MVEYIDQQDELYENYPVIGSWNYEQTDTINDSILKIISIILIILLIPFVITAFVLLSIYCMLEKR